MYFFGSENIIIVSCCLICLQIVSTKPKKLFENPFTGGTEVIFHWMILLIHFRALRGKDHLNSASDFVSVRWAVLHSSDGQKLTNKLLTNSLIN